MKFKNPTNGYVEEVSSPGLWVFLFGFFYFAVKGVWTHAIVSVVLAICTVGISWFVYPFLAADIMRKHYLKRGWIEVTPFVGERPPVQPSAPGHTDEVAGPVRAASDARAVLPPAPPAPEHTAVESLAGNTKHSAPAKPSARALMSIVGGALGLGAIAVGLFSVLHDPAGEPFSKCTELATTKQWLAARDACHLAQGEEGRSAKKAVTWLETHAREIAGAELQANRQTARALQKDVAQFKTLVGDGSLVGSIDSLQALRVAEQSRGFQFSLLAHDAIENGTATFKGRSLPAGISRVTMTFKNPEAGEVEYPCRYVAAIYDDGFGYWREIETLPCGHGSQAALREWRVRTSFHGDIAASWTTVDDPLVAGPMPSVVDAGGAPAKQGSKDYRAQAGIAPRGMVAVPAGEFTMGDDTNAKARPSRRVKITKPFFIDVTEVTVAEYAKCEASAACTPTSMHGPVATASEVERVGSMCNEQDSERGTHPINCVDRGQAAAYCSFVGKRLPTEAEWEYSARGPDGRIYPWGNEEPKCDKAVVSGCVRMLPDRASTKPVGSYPAVKSAFGALDMAGNVWEWVGDGWSSYDPTQVTDPAVSGAGNLGVIRGGSWDFGPAQLKASARWQFYVTNGYVNTGFRCAKDAASDAAL